MSKFHEEYHPLLQDEESHICNTSPKFQRRFRCSSSGRARVQAKGAAYIITHWPDHLSTVLTYWWIGLGMIALLIFIIYNSIIAVAILPPASLKPLKILNRHFNVLNNSYEKLSERNVYMHVFVNSYDELSIKDYLPYIERFSKKYTNFTYNFIVVINDTLKNAIEDYSDEVKNELALDALWDEKQHSTRQTHKKLAVQIVSLSRYMDESPLKKYWRNLPEKFIGFLSRCIAIWNKGGIALNPILFTPKSPNPIYIEKIEKIFGGTEVNMKTPNCSKKILKKPMIKVDNIQDIINRLENEDNIDHIDANMIEAENIKKSYYVDKKSHDYKSKRNANFTDKKENFTLTKHKNEDIDHENKFNDLDKLNYENDSHYIQSNKSYFKNSTTSVTKNTDNNDVDKKNLLPMFLKYLFHGNPNENLNSSSGDENITKNEVIKEFPNQKKHITIPENDFSPSFVEANNFEKDSNTNGATLTIDLNGNLIASATPCHAFLGTIFSNVFHHTDEESIKDFIITELSIFCKGTLSSCTGIDVILL